MNTDYLESRYPYALKVGEFGFFRHVDADTYDPDGFEIFYGMVTKLIWEDVDGNKLLTPGYVVLSTFGIYLSMGQCDFASDVYPPEPN
tara:strand:+ start:387 stop:650 length:264 start_codon:yes stop_codon:yes gene_type:complete